MPKKIQASDRIALQNAEFAAMDILVRNYKRCIQTAVVDDDYPEMRHGYESALRGLLDALRNNRGNGIEIPIEGSIAEIKQYQSIPHISTMIFARALRWHPNGFESWSESDWYTALAGEAGECFKAVLIMGDTIKKRNRVRDHMQQRATNEGALQHNLKMEIGDVYIYLDLLARRVGLNLEDCIRDTFNRISEREGFPERL